jgi:hypothetical protein
MWNPHLTTTEFGIRSFPRLPSQAVATSSRPEQMLANLETFLRPCREFYSASVLPLLSQHWAILLDRTIKLVSLLSGVNFTADPDVSASEEHFPSCC